MEIYPVELRPATADDCGHIAYLTNLAGEGLPEYLWKASAPQGISAQDFGAQRAARSQGNFSYRNVTICQDSGNVLGMMLSMRQPNPYELPDFSQLPPQVKPLVELEALAPGSYYINALATYAEYRGRGIGTVLLRKAEEIAAAKSIDTISLIVASENRGAEQLYRREGFTTVEQRAVIGYPGILHGGDWILMTKKL